MTPHRISVTRACVEIASIIFLFYSNLLMGEFTAANGRGKLWSAAFSNIFTLKNFGIGLISALLGFLVFETLRRKA
jgi:hypothetical protein